MAVSTEQIRRHVRPGHHETIVPGGGGGGRNEHHVTVSCLDGETPAAMCMRAARRLRDAGAHAVSLTAFDLGASHEGCLAALREVLGTLRFPVTFLDTLGPAETRRPGLEFLAVSGTRPEPIELAGRVIGCAWSDAGAGHCVLGDLRDSPRAGSSWRTPADQTSAVIEQMNAGLARAGLSFPQVYRTWFRNDDIVAWYGDFNRVRTAAYSALGVFDGLVPASTGIGAKNPHGAALVAGLRAAQGGIIRAVPSPLQNPAARYGSSFSRAVECAWGGDAGGGGARRYLTISGTASIGLGGETLHVGDTAAQIERTLEVVGAILTARGMGFQNTSRALAYLRHASDIPLFWRVARKLDLPVLVSAQTVCRDDLLFELELDAWA